MKKTLLFVVFLLVLCAQMSVVFGQEQEVIGADVTGQNRYLVIGKSQTFKGAEMVSALPKGVKCQPADEITGYKYWNSTGTDTANLVQLTAESEVAVDPKNRQLYLCYCGGDRNKFNKLFPATVTPVAETRQQPQVQRASYASVADLATPQNQQQAQVVYVVMPQPQQQQVAQQAPPPVAPVKQEKEKDTRSWCERHPKWCIGFSFAAGAGAGYGLAQIGGGSGRQPPIVRTLPVRQ